MKLSSSAFPAMGSIPREYTCEGADVSPPLEWSDVPEGTRSLALYVQDPDAPDPAAPVRTWVHWVIVDLPADTRALATGASTRLPAGARAGRNDWGKAAWGGPCPPIGRHRYFFELFALDTTLPALEAPTRAELEAAMQGHVLARAELMGTCHKGQHV
jgi:Raf kinase inhibitor-like YbhB/YbcL family protein